MRRTSISVTMTFTLIGNAPVEQLADAVNVMTCIGILTPLPLISMSTKAYCIQPHLVPGFESPACFFLSCSAATKKMIITPWGHLCEASCAFARRKACRNMCVARLEMPFAHTLRPCNIFQLTGLRQKHARASSSGMDSSVRLVRGRHRVISLVAALSEVRRLTAEGRRLARANFDGKMFQNKLQRRLDRHSVTCDDPRRAFALHRWRIRLRPHCWAVVSHVHRPCSSSLSPLQFSDPPDATVALNSADVGCRQADVLHENACWGRATIIVSGSRINERGFAM
jgi:hypothetical protein